MKMKINMIIEFIADIFWTLIVSWIYGNLE